MTKINLFDPIDGFQQVQFDGSIGDYIVDKFYGKGVAYSVYEGIPSQETDITFDVDKQVNGFGEYTVLQTPSAGLDVAAWVAIVSAVISVIAIAAMPKPDIPKNVNRQQQSPNNSLVGRTNRARPLERIPDIRGTVRSYPDIIAPPYFRYKDLQTRAEYGYYCVGRGEYTVTEILDGNTPISLVDGASAQIYKPFTSPNNYVPTGNDAIGEFIGQTVNLVSRSNEVDGRDLPGPQEVGDDPIIRTTNTSPTPGGETGMSVGNESSTVFYINVTRPGIPNWLSPDYYVGNYVILEDFLVTNDPFGDPIIYDWSGEYEITDVIQVMNDIYTIKLLKGSFVWPAGTNVPQIGSSMKTKYSTPYDASVFMTNEEYDSGFVNIVALNGLYRDKGTGTIKTVRIDFEVEVEPVNADGTGTGSKQIISGYLSGNSQNTRGVTIDFTLPYTTRFRCSVRRTTGYVTGEGSIMDDIKWEDLYGVKEISKQHFGDITTIQTVTLATKSATSLKERKLNCIATERLYPYLGSGVFSDTKVDNSSAVQSYIRDFIDPVMGNRPLVEVDADGLLAMQSDIDSYFGETNHHQFNYTLDSTDITFQEYTQMLFNAINSVAYRDGSVVKAKFEREDDTPSMLFTHRSKLPDSETYSRNMNYFSLNDGIEFVWVDPDTDTQEVIYIPADKSAVNPKKLEMAGFRDYIQANKRAWREYQKLINEKVSVEVEVLAGGRYLKPGDVFSIVKGTRTNTADGEVIAVSLDGYTLTLSQDVVFTPGDTHSIILKKRDGSVQSLVCTEGPLSNQVVLASLPDEAVYVGIDAQLRTEFSFGNEARHLGQLFIARSIDVSNRDSVIIRGVNYSSEYYAYDAESTNAFSDGFDEGFS